MATRGQQKKNTYNFNLSKKELEKKEKDAEKKSSERKAENKEKSTKEAKKRTTPNRVTRRQAQARRQIPSQVREMMISKEEDDKNKKAEQKNKPTRREAVQKRRSQADKVAPNRRQATKARRTLRDAGLRTEDRRTTSTSNAKTAAKTMSRIGRGAKALTGVGAALTPSQIGVGKGESRSMAEEMAKGQAAANAKRLKEQMAKAKNASAPKAKNYNLGVSKGGVSFKEAFAHFRKKGAKTFTWNGKKYTTELKK